MKLEQSVVEEINHKWTSMLGEVSLLDFLNTKGNPC